MRTEAMSSSSPMITSSPRGMGASEERSSIASDDAPSLRDRLVGVRRSTQSSYVILLACKGEAQTRASLSPVPASPSSPSSLALYAIDANVTTLAYGELEDGGLDALRQQMTAALDAIQFVVLRFHGEVFFVQCVAVGVSAVRRARSMVLGRSLASTVSSSDTRNGRPESGSTTASASTHASAPIHIAINHPRQLTDPLLRSKLKAAHARDSLGGRALESLSASTSFPTSLLHSPGFDRLPASTSSGQLSSPDVPTSVSSPSVHLTTASTSLSTLDSFMSRTPLPAVGLGIGGLVPILDYAKPLEMGTDPAALMLSHNEDDERSLSVSFPVPPHRLSTISGVTSVSSWGNAMLASGATIPFPPLTPETTVQNEMRRASFINESEQRQSTLHPHQSHSLRPTLSLSSILDALAAASGGNAGTQSNFRNSVSARSTSFSVSSRYTTFPQDDGAASSTYSQRRRSYNAEDERLEQERLDFLRWKQDQEAAIMAWERKREAQRRLADESKRDQVMRRLQAEQESGDQKTIGSGGSGSMKSFAKGKNALLPPLPYNPSSSAPKRQAHTTRRSFGSSTERPSIVRPNYPSPLVFSGHSTSSGSPTMQSNGKTAASQSSSQGSAMHGTGANGFPFDRQQRPLDGRVKAAIEREMRRPIVTMEGHVRTRVQPHRLRSRTTSEGVSRPTVPVGETSPLITSIMEAQRKGIAKKPSAPSMWTPPFKWDSGERSLKLQPQQKPPSMQLPPPPPPPSHGSPLTAAVRTEQAQGRIVGAGWVLHIPKTNEQSARRKELPPPPWTIEAGCSASEMSTADGPREAWTQHDDTGAAEKPKQALEFADSDDYSFNTPSGGEAYALHSTIDTEDPPKTPEEESALPWADTNSLSAAEQPEPTKGTLMDQIFMSKMSQTGTSAPVPAKTAKVIPGPSKRAEEVEGIIKFRPKSQALSVSDYGVDEEGGLTDAQLKDILGRQSALDRMLTDLRRKRTLDSDKENSARVLWSQRQAEREKLAAWERSICEARERQRRELAAKQETEEGRRALKLEAERQAAARVIAEEEARRLQALKTVEQREKSVRDAERFKTANRLERRRSRDMRLLRRRELRDTMQKREKKGEMLAGGVLTLQTGDNQRRRRHRFELHGDGLRLFSETRSAVGARLDDASECIPIMPGCIISLTDAYEAVQIPHAFSLQMFFEETAATRSERESSCRSRVEDFLAYTDTEETKEELIVGIAWLARLSEDVLDGV